MVSGSLYTDASNKSLPDDLRLCCFLSVLNSPLEERKSGTRKDQLGFDATRALGGGGLTAGCDRDTCTHNHNNLALLVEDPQQQVEGAGVLFAHEIVLQVQLVGDARLGLGSAPLFAGRAVIVARSRRLHGVRER